MSTMTDRPARRAPTQGAQPAPRMRRTVEIILVALGMAGSLVVMGGFALVMNTVDQATFAEAVMPALVGADADVARAHEAARVLAAWFGVSLIVLLLLGTAGIALARSRPSRRSTGWLFLAAGLVCLLGSQLLLFPIAFLFLAAAALCALRPLPEGSPR